MTRPPSGSDTRSDAAALAEACLWQSATAARLRSPFAAEFLNRLAGGLGPESLLAGLTKRWRGRTREELIADAVPLRIMAAVHDIALEGQDPRLSEQFARAGEDTEWSQLWPLVLTVFGANADRINEFMAHEPQTNEVGRSACLLGGFLTVAAETGFPLRCFEIGASAGLNLNWDRYRYALGPHLWGDRDAGTAITADWTGAPPPLKAPVAVIERAGCDRRPVDLGDVVERRRLRAYVWADRPDRLARLDQALRTALAHQPVVERADAAEWVARKLRPAKGAATVLYHSVVWQYLTPREQAHLERLIDELGRRATVDAPFAWLRMEPPEPESGMELLLSAWPGGRTRVLAAVHPHGGYIHWRSRGEIERTSPTDTSEPWPGASDDLQAHRRSSE